MSFAAAKKEVESRNQFQGASFASVVRKKSDSIGVSSSSIGAQVGSGIPSGMLEQLRKEFPNVNRPSLVTGQISISTQARPGSHTLASAPQAAKTGQATKPAPPPKPSSLTPTPARQEVRVDAPKSKTSASAPQAAEAKQAAKSVAQASKPATTTRAPSTQTPARQEVRAEVHKTDSRTPTPSQQEVRPGLSDFFI